MNETCQHCGHLHETTRVDYQYWPDHLWVPNIQARFRCPKCATETWTWAHELPVEWHEDWKRFQWKNYCLPRLLYSAEEKGFVPEPRAEPNWFTPGVQRIGNWFKRLFPKAAYYIIHTREKSCP